MSSLVVATLSLSMFLLSHDGDLQEKPVVLSRIESKIVVDGISDEPAWQKVKPLPLTMYSPSFRGEISERTEIRVAYDDNYLYLAGRLYESNPSQIQANSLIRDLDRGGDFLNLLVDSFNDNETLVAFVTTPSGNRLDAEITNDAEGSDFFNQDWNAFWDVAVVENDSGWFAEMRIPFSSLKFQDENGKVTLGLMTHRLIGRKNERVTFPAVPPRWSTGQWKASNAQDVELHGVYNRRPVYLLPYVLGGVSKRNLANTNSNLFESNSDVTREAGLDLKYNLSNNISLDLSVNTDFAQVESDDEQVNLTRFSLFFPEKRQFFQERSGLFSFKTGDFSRIFHSRRIGLTENGQPVRIFGGLRMVGRFGSWDWGILDMQTDESSGLNSENFGTFRLKRRVINPYSYVGSIVTSRVADNGDYNFVYGLDSRFRINDTDYLSMKWAQSFDTEDETRSTDFLNRAFNLIRWEKRNTVGLGATAEFRHNGEKFDPEMGFNLRSNFLYFQGTASWGWLASNQSAIFKHLPSVGGEVYLRNGDNAVESSSAALNWRAEFKSGDIWNLEFRHEFDSLLQPFFLAEKTSVPVGDYHFDTAQLSLEMSQGKRMRTNLTALGGSFYDGNRLAFKFEPNWNLSRYLEISSAVEYNRVRFSQRNQELDAIIARFRLQGAVNTKLSGSGFIQYNNVDNRVGVNFRVRYNFREGNDLYLVYNELFNTERQRDDLRLPRSDNRVFLMKYTYALIK